MRVIQFACLLILPFISIGQVLDEHEFPIDSRGSYLHTSSNDVPQPPLIIDLEQLNLFPGDTIEILTRGVYKIDKHNRVDKRPIRMIGVFSMSNKVLSKEHRHRIPVAVSTDSEVITRSTYYKHYATDIPEDFKIDKEFKVIPDRCKYLILSTNDNFFKDNKNEHDFRIIVRKWRGERLPNLKKITFVKVIPISLKTFSLTFWDDKIEDGDTISLYLNNIKVLGKTRVRKKKQQLEITLKSGDNQLVMVAENLGKIGKNTAAFTIKDSDQEHNITLNAEIGKSEGIKLVYNP